jgi:hypothetical protein
MTIPNFSDFDLTSAFWSPDDSTVTVDAQQRASAFEDSLGLIADYTQATNANKPLYSRADNKENILGFANSENLTSGWSVGATVILNATTFRENTANSTHEIYATGGTVAISGKM